MARDSFNIGVHNQTPMEKVLIWIFLRTLVQVSLHQYSPDSLRKYLFLNQSFFLAGYSGGGISALYICICIWCETSIILYYKVEIRYFRAIGINHSSGY